MMHLLAVTALLAGPARASDAPPPWRLVGAYDAAALLGLQPDDRPDWTWQPDAALSRSCGPAKAPDGLDVFDAQAMSGGLTPTLALVLERQDHDGAAVVDEPLRADQVRVALGKGKPQVTLHPAVMPRAIRLELERTPSEPDTPQAVEDARRETWQLLLRQLEMLLCLEHKVGRGWIGGPAESVRQAILLAPPDADPRGRPLADRKYFGGQQTPVPPLLGPPRACIVGGVESSTTGGRGEASVDLVPADLWGATVGPCGAGVRPESLAATPEQGDALPLVAGDGHLSWTRQDETRWSTLRVRREADRETGEDCYVAEWGPQREPLLRHCPGAEDAASRDLETLPDVLATVPYTLPSLGTDAPGERHRYTVLLIPNWQLVEAAYRIENPNPGTPLQAPLPQGVDAVSWVLEHSEQLFVQVKPDGSSFQTGVKGEEARELTTALGGIGPEQPMRWGYMSGLIVGRRPVALPGALPPTWEQVRRAHRADEFGAVVAGVALLLLFLLAGLLRLPEMWTRQPAERAAYWPGRGGKPQAGTGAPDGPATDVITSGDG